MALERGPYKITSDVGWNKLVFWNCWGVSKLTSRAYLQELVCMNNPIAIVLLETRGQMFTHGDVDRLIGRAWSFDFMPSNGKSRGIILLWLDNIIKLPILVVHTTYRSVARQNTKVEFRERQKEVLEIEFFGHLLPLDKVEVYQELALKLVCESQTEVAVEEMFH
ncbi:hypothetical protein KSP40_PGU014990 [Platanthera guangdongensis]|uniref:Uncharacterized protein n=1 Tax=Platanthera guangdongensis TaxID=2320717 RepID=A0ABR2M535_9ASPA